jgi:hypothetical protein
MYSPLKEMSGFNRYVNTLKVKMAPRVWKTGIIQESKPRRISPNTTTYSLQQEEERQRKERETPVSKAW